MGFLVFALAFWYGGVVVDKDQCAVNDMFTAVMAIVFGAMMAGQVSSFAPDYGKAKTAAIDIFRIVDTPAPIAAMEEQGDAMPECKGVIELENVRFTYPSRPDQVCGVCVSFFLISWFVVMRSCGVRYRRLCPGHHTARAHTHTHTHTHTHLSLQLTRPPRTSS